MSDSVTIERFLTREEVPAFFRDLADALEHGGESELACVEDFTKFKLTLKDEYGQVSLKLKAKVGTCTPPADMMGEGGKDGQMAKPKYSDLKKRMRSSFKVVAKMINMDQLPPQAAIDSFISDSRLMCTYPGKGDEFYEEYLLATAAFEAACKDGDLAKMKETVMELASQKGRCHAKYD